MDDADLAVSLLTLGDPMRLSGGYLYHRRIAEAAPSHRARVTFVSFPDRPFPLPALHGRRVLAATAGSDVLLLDSIAAAFLGAWRPWLSARRLRVPLVAILHQPPGGIDHGRARTLLQARLDRLAYARARRLLVASDALAAQLAAMGMPRQRMQVVAPGRDVAVAPAGSAPDLREGRRAALLCVGNWIPRKGILELLEAVARLPPDAATLHLVGDDRGDAGYRRLVLARLARPDLAARVRVHGPVARERVAALYRAADVFALPSVREPYGTVYGEAMAAGLPVVGWRAGNLPYLAEHDREGLILPVGDVDGLAAALSRLVDDEDERRRLGQAAARRAASLPTWDDTARRLFAVLREVAAAA